MSASSSWDTFQPPTPDSALQPLDLTGEPVGFDLGATPYEQPPVPEALLTPLRTATLPSRDASVGLVLSAAGLVATPFLPFITLPLVFAGVMLSALTLGDCRRGMSGGRERAWAGVVLGVAAAVLTLVIFLSVMPASTIVSPG